MYFEYFYQFVNLIERTDKFSAGVYIILGKIVGDVVLFPGTPLTVLAGAVLGSFWGTVVSIVGNVIGASCAFLISRYLLKNFIQNKVLKKYPKVDRFEGELSKNGFFVVLFLRLVPVFPFNILNFLLGVTEVKFKDYFFGTLVGIIPGTFLFVYFGESVKMFSLWNVLFAVLGILGLGYVGKFWKTK
jgi:uncharacterized membrane protein YdjX (TVP38/TMEM64 family)